MVNESLLVDAGTVATALTLDEQQEIQYILLSHLHIDHIKGLPPLVDNRVGLTRSPIHVVSIPEVIAGLKNFIFNDAVFPNFFADTGDHLSQLKELPLRMKQEIELCGLRITPIPVNHTVPTVGFIIQDDHAAWLYSGDTHITDELWSVAATLPHLKAAFIETSFPDEMGDLARASKHLTPSLLAQEFHKLGHTDLPLYVYHLKPSYRDRIIDQLHHLHIPNLTILEEGQEIHL